VPCRPDAPPFGSVAHPCPPACVRRTTTGHHAAVTPGRPAPYLHAAISPSARQPSRRPPLSPPPPVSRSSDRSCHRPTVSLSPIGPVEPPQVTYCRPCASPRRNPEPSRLSPPATAEPPRRRLLRPNRDRQPTLGEHALDPEPFPGRKRRWSRRISGEPAVPWVEGPNCAILNLFRGLVAKIHLQ
jgi:hypothetical protein